ncbi:ankyrin repeat-containing protein At5g02620-like [Prosopis cineraria]|uniref:ankyrin repeat-containing protein At5g02620-like n=1 Tax=Prosopis cineraria TaxID=364024 RepID=UPI00240F4276|nr:ankyrin repeat-containing protein At5g02620-like [Prosopis cineraria]
MSLLYEAAYSGNISQLNSLIQQCSHILHNTSQTSFTETPLHISSLLGHLQFTKKLLSHKPNLSLELNSSRMTALHLASAEGHIHVVKELLRVNNEPCLFRDEEGRIPLHYAAMRGRTVVVQELIRAKPESLSFRHQGKTVFHLCVTYNHLETLKALVELESAITGELLNCMSSDDAGNTLLHFAVMLKRVEVISYLVSIPEIREIANLKNQIGLTARDIVEHSPIKDLKICEIQHMLAKAEKERFEADHHPQPPRSASTEVELPQKGNCCMKTFQCIGNWFMKILKRIENWLKHEDDWLEKMRGNLSLVSTVIATITFQAMINPPGGFIQQGLLSKNNTASSNDLLNCTTFYDGNTYCPGEAISFLRLPDDFQQYLIFLTVSFYSSLGVTLLLVSGFPMKNKAVIWLLSLGMCITLSSLAFAFLSALSIVVPTHLLEGNAIQTMMWVTIMVWTNLLGLILVLITLRFQFWIWKRCAKIIKRLRSWRSENGCCRFAPVFFMIVLIFFLIVIILVQLIIIFYLISRDLFFMSGL